MNSLFSSRNVLQIKQTKNRRTKGLSLHRIVAAALLSFIFCFWVLFIVEDKLHNLKDADHELSRLQNTVRNKRKVWKSRCGLKLKKSGFLLDSGKVGKATTSVWKAKHAFHAMTRRKLYESMEDVFLENGLRLDEVNLQGFTLNDIFEYSDTEVKPKLRHLSVPTRAVVGAISDLQTAEQLGEAVLRYLVPVLPAGGVWLQNNALLHTTIFHASSHLDTVRASEQQITHEISMLRAATETMCPMRIVLERVVITSGGVVLGCWQIVGGTEPLDMRERLKTALPQAPTQVIKDGAILHTTLARIVKPPESLEGGGLQASGEDAVLTVQGRRIGPTEGLIRDRPLQWAAESLTEELCGMVTVLDKLWYVEEEDMWALALDGTFSKHSLELKCMN